MSNCFEKTNELNYCNMPCHLRNNSWLSKLLYVTLIEKGINISLKQIKKFMNTSKEFVEARHNYELEIVRWQINWMKKGGDGFLLPNKYDEFYIYSSEVDIAFRSAVVSTLKAIGMDSEVIEEGIERFSDLWRENYMNKAFSNKFESVQRFST